MFYIQLFFFTENHRSSVIFFIIKNNSTLNVKLSKNRLMVSFFDNCKNCLPK